MSLPEPESPSPIDAFLAQFEKDQEAGCVGSLEDYLSRFPGGWVPLGSGANGEIRALAVFDDGSGPAVYAGGCFHAAPGQPGILIAKWDGNTWTYLGTADWFGCSVTSLSA